jgi:hypothetical protein
VNVTVSNRSSISSTSACPTNYPGFCEPSWVDGFVRYLTALGHVVLANLEAVARVDADRAGWWIGSEGFGCHVAATADDEPAAEKARARDQLVWDLHFGVSTRRRRSPTSPSTSTPRSSPASQRWPAGPTVPSRDTTCIRSACGSTAVVTIP